MYKRKIIIDCDPGIDDAIAIMLASAAGDKLDILGITTVAGNQSLECVTSNALKLCNFLNLDIPVAAGAKLPLIRDKVDAAHIHGSTGLGNEALPETKKNIVSSNAVTFMFNKIFSLPENEKVTLVPTGPLTNIALLLKVFPEVIDKIEMICLMGGSASKGNVTPHAEFNIWEDPEAAAIVFKSGVPTVMCGLDVTNKCGPLCSDVYDMLKSQGKYTSLVGRMLEFYVDVRGFSKDDIVSVHDASAIMYLLHPEIYSGKKSTCIVNLSDEKRGATIFDFNDEDNASTTVLLEADSEKFRKYMLEYLNILDNA